MTDEDVDARLERLPWARLDAGAHLGDDTLLSLASGRLADEERASCERHLARCADCRALHGELARSLDAPPLAWPAPVRSRKRWWAAAAAMAAAAGILLALTLRPPEEARYRLVELRGMVQDQRGAPSSGDPLFDLGGRVELVIKPDGARAGHPTLWASPVGGPLREVAAKVSAGKGGGYRLEAEVEAFAAEPGRYVLGVAVDARGIAGARSEDVASDLGRGRWLSVMVEVRAAQP